nr:hypothetical protein [uncultured Mediterranean phage uvMED]
MNWLLNCVARWCFKQRHGSIRRYPSVRDDVQFVYCKMESTQNGEIDALALARFTSYDPDNRALAVEQVTYQDDEDGHTQFQSQVTSALHFGIDVAVISPYDLDYFPLVERITCK